MKFISLLPTEANNNYQGLKFAIDLCEGKTPLLKKSEENNWSLRKPFDISPYLILVHEKLCR